MTSLEQVHQKLNLPNLLPFDFRRDMLEVADLVELCFAERLDEDGHRLVQQFRSAARGIGGIDLGFQSLNQFPMTLAGFVWREDLALIGNLNLVPIRYSGERAYLIANVAVHPDYRRRGIANALTDSAIDYLQEKRIKWCWLQVDDDNLAAINLYQQSGFDEQSRTTIWQIDPPKNPPKKSDQSEIKVNSPSQADWSAHQAWLSQTYPPSISWHLPLRYKLLQPGIQGMLNRLFSNKQISQWAARKNDQLIGVLSRQSSATQADKLWLAASPENDAEAINYLLPHAQRARPRKRTLSIEYPADRAVDDLTHAGFYNHQTLIWMKKEL